MADNSNDAYSSGSNDEQQNGRFYRDEYSSPDVDQRDEVSAAEDTEDSVNQ